MKCGKSFPSNQMYKTLLLVVMVVLFAACTPEVGSKKWCDTLELKAKGDWTFNEAKDYTKHCLFNAEK